MPTCHRFTQNGILQEFTDCYFRVKPVDGMGCTCVCSDGNGNHVCQSHVHLVCSGLFVTLRADAVTSRRKYGSP